MSLLLFFIHKMVFPRKIESTFRNNSSVSWMHKEQKNSSRKFSCLLFHFFQMSARVIFDFTIFHISRKLLVVIVTWAWLKWISSVMYERSKKSCNFFQCWFFLYYFRYSEWSLNSRDSSYDSLYNEDIEVVPEQQSQQSEKVLITFCLLHFSEEFFLTASSNVYRTKVKVHLFDVCEENGREQDDVDENIVTSYKKFQIFLLSVWI